eukprot:UN25682
MTRMMKTIDGHRKSITIHVTNKRINHIYNAHANIKETFFLELQANYPLIRELRAKQKKSSGNVFYQIPGMLLGKMNYSNCSRNYRGSKWMSMSHCWLMCDDIIIWGRKGLNYIVGTDTFGEAVDNSRCYTKYRGPDDEMND